MLGKSLTWPLKTIYVINAQHMINFSSTQSKAMGFRCLLAALTLLGFFGTTFGQDNARGIAPQNAPIIPIGAEASPTLVANTGPQMLGAAALWDIQFSYNTTDSTNGDLGMAAANFINNEFWVSRWASDTLYRFDINGNLLSEFTIANLSGTRSFTTDGTNLYAANASNTISIINPTTQMVTGTITSQASVTARHCTYDSTLDNGNGGFWTGNFNTDIVSISMTGAVLSTISTATHGLGGMYGSAFDNVSTGGPYLWIFHQGGTAQSEITQLQLPAGTPTGITHDALGDVGVNMGLTSALAGGLFITDQIVSGQWTIGGLLQGTPDNVLFGYELSDPTPAGPDASVTGLRNTRGYTRIPMTQNVADAFQADVANVGIVDIDTVYVDFEVSYGGSPVWTDTQSSANLATGGNIQLVSAPYTPASGMGDYDVSATVRTTVADPDTFPTNDSTFFNLMMTDSVYARDDDVPNANGYTINSTDFAYAVMSFDVIAADDLSAIWVRAQNPVAGDTTFGVVTLWGSGGPTQVLATGTPILYDTATNEYLLQFPGGLSLIPGTYGFGLYQGPNRPMSLSQSDNYFTADVNYFFINQQGWFASGVQTARFIRPIFGTPLMINIEDELAGPALNVYPNPNAGSFFVKVNAALEAQQVEVIDMVGRVVTEAGIEAIASDRYWLDLTSATPGVYFVRVIDAQQRSHVQKVVLNR